MTSLFSALSHNSSWQPQDSDNRPQISFRFKELSYKMLFICFDHVIYSYHEKKLLFLMLFLSENIAEQSSFYFASLLYLSFNLPCTCIALVQPWQNRKRYKLYVYVFCDRIYFIYIHIHSLRTGKKSFVVAIYVLEV